MDKRSFLAIGVTFAILLVWQVFYVMPRQKEATRRNVVQLKEQAVADSLAEVEAELAKIRDIDDRERPAALPASGNDEYQDVRDSGSTETWQAEGGFFFTSRGIASRLFTIENEKMRVVFSTRGAKVESLRLPGFRRKNGEEVELIPADKGGGLALALEHQGVWKSLAETEFSVTVNGAQVMDGERIVLSDQLERADVVFIRAGAAGERVEKKYSFARDGFEVGLS
ncbi:MAG: hypothetical protein KAV42_08785, partial [Candidatus Krumholzibacteria bacterium]|nr:hypothetical protein [Candidatus Krumholzibacteria bacterium]